MFFISDPDFGGYKFQIAKGRVDQENHQNAAIREAEEEIGLTKKILKK
jgi:8-oxo-dGTP pyrophosphatase MutT (NUDIX family)